jgi:hypothetical protein
MNKKKIKKISNVLSIFHSLNNEDLDYFCLNANDESIKLFLEVIFNLITNEKISERATDKNLFETVRGKMRNNKKKWCSIIKSKNNKSKVNFIRKQIGSGILADISSLIIPILLTLI